MASSLLLSSRKSDTVLGTFESDAFHLSLRSDTELSQLHQYGYHRIPHIGVYGEFYSPCLPLVLISLPAVKKVMKKQLPPSVLQVLYPEEAQVPEAMEVGSLITSPIPKVAAGGEDPTLPPSGGKREEDEVSSLQPISKYGNQEGGIDSTNCTANSTTGVNAASTTTSTPTNTAPSAATTAITVPPSPSDTDDRYGCICCSANEAEEAGCLLRLLQFVAGVIWKSFELNRCMCREENVVSSSPILQIEAAPEVGSYGRLVGGSHYQYEADENRTAPPEDPDTEHLLLASANTQPMQDLNVTDRAVSFQVDNNTDFFIVFHPFPPPSPCQKFLCDNMDEINLVYHCWMCPDAPYSEDYTHTEQLPMGIFEADGVKPVHQDLKDAGVAFGCLEERTVCIHGCRFSPENAQMQLTHATSVITFFSVARHGERQVVTYHVVCGNDKAEAALKESLKGVQTLADLLQTLQKDDMFQDCAKTVERLLLPLAVAPQWSQSPSD